MGSCEARGEFSGHAPENKGFTRMGKESRLAEENN
jgi:hypothetical protein